MSNRAVLIPELSLLPENISLVTEEPASGLKTKPAVRGASNEGRLDPNPVAAVSDAYDIDVYERTAGNVGAARAGWKDSSSSVYRGKSPAHVPHHMQWLHYGATSAERFFRPKALSLQSGELLVMFVTGTGQLRWFTFVDGVAGAVTVEDSGFTAANIVMADVVQMPDGELVMMILGSDANSQVRLVKKTSRGDTGATIVWHFGPTELNTVGLGGALLSFGPTGFAIEVMKSGRIAMLVKRYGTSLSDIVRTFSDDRGVTWADLVTASSYEEVGYGIGSSTDYLGGCSIVRDPETGSLIAVCGVAKADTAAMPGIVNEPSVLGLVSDDGENWTGLVKSSEKDLDDITTGNVFDFPFYEEGMVEAAVVVGDDGLVKFIGALHGDSGNAAVSGYFDDFCMLSTRKSGISAKDGAPQIPSGTDMGSNDVLTCSDAFDAQVNTTTGFRLPTRWEIALNRFAVTGGTAGGDLDSGSVDYAGPRFVEAVLHDGMIYLFAACEDTGATQYALGYTVLNVWDELWEKGGLVTATASALKGFVYSSDDGWMAAMTPTAQGITVVNGGAQVLDGVTKGLRFNPAAAITTFGTSFATYGARPNPLLQRFIMKATSGGSLAQDDIAMRLTVSDGTDQIDISIRFDVNTSSILIRDNVSAFTVDTTVIDFTTIGVEVIVVIETSLKIGGIFYRALTADPEDAVTVEATGATAYVAGTNLATTTETWIAGTHTATSPDSTWMGVWLSRGIAASSPGDAFLWDGVNDWAASPPIIEEFGQDETPYDDGLSHGGRAQVVRAYGQYYRSGRLAWKGAAGREGNVWDIASANRFEGENVTKTPIARYWRSIDDTGTVAIELDAGNDALFNPQAVALFGINARQFAFQMDPTGAFNSDAGSPAIDVEVDVTGGDVDRHLLEFDSFTVGGTDNREVTVTGAFATTQPMTPHQFRSNDRVTWYVWDSSAAVPKSVKILDNDGYKLILASSVVGADGTFYIYPDRIGFNVSGGALGTGGGYRFMRVRFEAQDLSEGYYRLGQAIIGQLLNLNTSGLHPEWGWERQDTVPVSQADISTGGQRITNLFDGALQRYAFGWTGLRGRSGHASLDSFQGVRDDYDKLLALYQKARGGELPLALFPRYGDGREESAARSFDVIPCLMSGSFSGSQVAYENCRGGDIEGAVKAILDVAPFIFTEIT